MEITVQWFLSPWPFTSLSTCAHFSTQPSFPSFILLLSFGNVYSQMDHFKCNFTKVCNSFLLSLTQNPIFSPWHMKSCRIKFSPPLLRHLKPFSCSPQRRFLLLLCMCLVAQSCPTLCYHMDCSPPGSSVHGILQARILEWVDMTSSRGPFHARDRSQVSHIAGRLFYHLSYQRSPRILEYVAYPFSRGSSRPRNWTGVSCIAGGLFTNRAIREALEITGTP